MAVDYTAAFIYSFITTVGFAVLFHAPRTSLATSGFIGAVGWIIFVHIGKELGHSSFYANLIATIAIALMSELSARIAREPSTIFVIPGVIPLVPGLGMYQGMTKFIEKNYDAGMAILLTAITDAMAIALGIMLVTSVFRVLLIRRRRKHKELLALQTQKEQSR